MTTRKRSTRRPTQPRENASKIGAELKVNENASLVLWKPKEVATITVFVTDEDTKQTTRTRKRAILATPYRMVQVVNHALAQRGVLDKEGKPKIVQGPMLYTYASQKKYKTYRAADGTNRIVVDEESFIVWLETFVERSFARYVKQQLRRTSTAA